MRLKLLVLAFAALSLFTACKNSYDFKFQPRAGSKYEVRMTTNSLTGQEMMGQKMEVKSLTEMVMLYDIQSAASDTAKTIKVTFKSLKSKQSANGQETVTDTNNPDTSNAVTKMMHAMMGSEFVVTMNSEGEVREVKGMNGLLPRIIAASNNTDEVTKEQMVAGMKNFMSDEILKNMMEQSFKIFPGNKVKTGDSWRKMMVIAKPMPMNIDSKFTLKDADGKLAKVNVASVITPGQGGMEMMGMKIETEMSGTQSGSMDIDMETGMTISSDITQKVGGKMKAMGQEIPMTINSVITTKWTRL